MRKLPAGVAISAAVHVAVAAIVSSVELGPDEARPTPAPRIEVIDVVPPASTPEPPAMEVAVLPPEDTARIPELAPPAIATPVPARDRSGPTERREVAIIQPGRATTETQPGPTTTEPPGRNPLFDMRRGRLSRQELGVGPTDYRDALDHYVPPGTGAQPDVPESGKLQPDGGGTYRSDQGVFTAKVAKDGTVSLKDKRNFHYSIPLRHPGRLVRSMGRGVADWYHDDNKPVGLVGRAKPGPGETRVNLNEAVEGQSDLSEAYGTGKKPDHGQAPVPIANGGFDITDALMRNRGMDPYAAKKLAFLDATRDERVEMAKRYRKEQLASASRITKENLDRLAATVRDPAARKQALFELWDEVEETGSDELVAAANASRKLIIGFIRTHLPRGSVHAYTVEELAAFNAKKQSSARFLPYE